MRQWGLTAVLLGLGVGLGSWNYAVAQGGQEQAPPLEDAGAAPGEISVTSPAALPGPFPLPNGDETLNPAEKTGPAQPPTPPASAQPRAKSWLPLSPVHYTYAPSTRSGVVAADAAVAPSVPAAAKAPPTPRPLLVHEVTPAASNPPQRSMPKPPPVVEPVTAGKGPANAAPLGAQNPTLYLEKIGPASLGLGKPLSYEIIVRNNGAAAVFNVHVRDELPTGASLLKAEPKAEIKGDLLTWGPGTLEPGAELRYKIEVQPAGEGEFLSTATATFSASSSLQTKVVQPRLALTKTGPSTAQVGDPAVFKIKVTNTGSGPATNVVLHDHLPAGLKHAQGDDVEADLGTLAPGQSKDVTLQTTAVKSGRQVNEAIVMADNGLQASAQAVVNVTEAALLLRKTGPQRRFLNRDAEFDLEVANTGTGPASNVQVVDTLPAELEFVSASEGGTYDESSRGITWKLGSLGAGQRRGLSVKVATKGAGHIVNRAVARADRIAEVKSEAPIHVEGVPALMLEVVDLDDPVEVGAETTYEIRVVNQGTCASTGIQIIATVPKELTTVGASGPTSYRVQGQQVIFEPMTKLAARADALYRVKVQAQHPGDLRFKVQLTGDQLQIPVFEEESTRVYSDTVGPK